MILHVCTREEWQAARAAGRYGGSTQDRADGFIHFSTPDQVRASAARHRAGQDGLALLWVDPERLGDDQLRWEPSRGGALFPHVYGDLPLHAVARVDDLPLGPGGAHVFPQSLAGPDGKGKEVPVEDLEEDPEMDDDIDAIGEDNGEPESGDDEE